MESEDELSKWHDEDGILEIVVLDYGGSVSRILHVFSLSLCTILIRLSLIANFILLFPSVFKIL